MTYQLKLRWFTQMNMLVILLLITFLTLSNGVFASESTADSESTAETAPENPIHSIPILCYSDVLADYRAFAKGKNVLELTEYGGHKSRRDVIELVIIQQALHRAGYTVPVRFETMNEITYKRAVDLMQSSDYMALCNTNWLLPTMEAENIQHTSVVIPSEKFIAGLFAPEAKVNTLNITSLEDARRYKVVCNPNWIQDQEAIDAMGLNCMSTPHWPNMVKMLDKGRGDFMIAPFQSNPGSLLEAYGYRFKPVPGVKVKFNDDRVFIISKTYPSNQAFYTALEKGLNILREEGLLDKAYTDSGFYNPEVENWTLLNP